MERLLIIAGIGQLLLAAGSLAIPRVLGWRDETAKLQPLTRQVFWTYAGYIWSANVAFGLLSALAPHWLLDGGGLARSVSAFIALYWGARAVIQVVLFSRHAPPGRLYRLADVGLLVFVAFLTVVYSMAALGTADS